MTNLPKFSDFLDTLDHDTLLEITNSAIPDSSSSSSIPVGEVSLKLSISLLEKYHEWLMKQLQQQIQD
ncbi:hypothetical protein D8911_11635 [Levilactobacillus brevis]|nr:hypothetical protein D8911_11635 [Levilactobacillus brevis]